MAKQFAQGTAFKIGDGADPEVFTKIAHVKDISFPSATNDLVDVTDHDSPNRRKEYIAGLIDSDELNLPLNWDPNHTTHATLQDLANSGEIVNFQIEMLDTLGSHGTQFTFAGIVRKFAPKAPVNGVYGADVTIKPTGDVDVTPAA